MLWRFTPEPPEKLSLNCSNSDAKMKNCASSEVAIWQNCSAAMSPTHQNELPPEMTVDPLPLCHYCCHRGSGNHPVHYFVQCMCDESSLMTVLALVCAIAQVLNLSKSKHWVFLSTFWGKTFVDPAIVPKANSIAEERTEKPRGYRPFCTSESCVRYMKEDGLCL